MFKFLKLTLFWAESFLNKNAWMFRCSKFCLDKGFPVASLRTDHCYCTNALPLKRLYEGVDNTKECNLFCSGVYGKEGRCERDQCCGGQQKDGRHTYTVFIFGSKKQFNIIFRFKLKVFYMNFPFRSIKNLLQLYPV